MNNKNTKIIEINDLVGFKESFESLNLKNKNITSLKEKLLLYRGVSKQSYNILPSIYRLFDNDKKVETIKMDSIFEKDYYNSLKGERFFESENTINVSLLARAQHYGYTSRMVDLTYNKLISVYFAVNENLGDNGKIYTFAHAKNKSKKGIVSIPEYFYYSSSSVDADKQKNISRKMLLFSDISSNIIGNKNYVEVIKKEEENKNARLIERHLIDPVVIIEEKEFKHNNSSYDSRYNSQKGMFLLFGNKIENDVISKNINCELDESQFEMIFASHKIAFLYELSRLGISYITIYPDDDKSNDINKTIKIVKTLKMENRRLHELDLFEKYKDIFDMIKLESLINELVDNQEDIVGFILSDLFYLLKNKTESNSKAIKSNLDFLFNSYSNDDIIKELKLCLIMK